MQKPKPPSYLGSEALDYVMRMNVELLSELWILRDRVEVLEYILESKDILAPAEIDDFTPNGTFKEYLEGQRNLLVENVVGAPYRSGLTVAELIERTHRHPPRQPAKT